MKLALVVDTPREGSVATRRYVHKTIEAVEAHTGVRIQYTYIPVIPDDLPGGKVPGIALVKENRDEFIERLLAYEPDAITTLGPAAAHAMIGEVTKQREIFGVMKMWEGIPWVPNIIPYNVIRNGPDLHRDFIEVMRKLATQERPLPQMDIELIVAQDPEHLRASLELLEGASVIGVDVETTGLSAYSNETLAVGFGAVIDDKEGIAVVVPRDLLKFDEVHDLMWGEMSRKKRRAVGHNFKFDMQFIHEVVGDWPHEKALIGDTLLLAHLLDERPAMKRARGSGLKHLVAQRYDYSYGFDFKTDASYSEAELDDMHTYLADDVVYTARLWMDLEREANEESPKLLEAHDEMLMPIARAIAKCELAGAPVDVAWIKDAVEYYDNVIAVSKNDLEERIQGLTTLIEVTNILSPSQIMEVMHEWTWTDAYNSTDKETLEAAVSTRLGSQLPRDVERAKWVQDLLQLRKDVKLRTTFTGSLLDHVDDDDRIRASFLLHGAATGRISSQKPNLQNIPAVSRVDSEQTHAMRKAFRPRRKDWSWVEVDYSQLELRVAAALSGDQAMREVFENERDIHMEVAMAIFSKPEAEISKAERFLAKAVSFGIIYGRGAHALATGTEMEYAERELGMTPWTEDIANAFIKKFLKSYPDLQHWITDTHESVIARQYVESPFGRRRRFPFGATNAREKARIERQGVNTPVQGTASDICLTAMVDVIDGIDQLSLNATVLFPVHDSICIEVETSQIGELEALCRNVMEVPYLGVPLTVDFEYGPTWAETK